MTFKKRPENLETKVFLKKLTCLHGKLLVLLTHSRHGLILDEDDGYDKLL